MAGPRARWRFARVALIVCGIAAAGSAALPVGGIRAAGATVDHRAGYAATVEGWTSWYGSYGMGDLGSTWCIDHGIPAPDPAYGYQPTAVADRAVATRQAMAWALGQYGPGADRVSAAALTLVLHDLAGAQYPHGRLDVDTLLLDQLAGFGGAERAVLDRARVIKRDAVAHSRLVPPIRLEAGRDPGGPAVVVRVVDSAGQPVTDATITLAGTGATATSGATGRARLAAPAAGSAVRVEVTLPDLRLDAFAPHVAVAQRVARPARSTLSVQLTPVAAPTTTSPPTTTPPTTSPPTTTPPTTSPPTTTPPTTTPPGTTPPSTSPPTTAPRARAAEVLPATPPPSPPESGPTVPTLPFTGAPTTRLLRLGTGLLLLGLAARLTERGVGS